MSELIAEVEAHAMKLTVEQRAELVDRLLASFPLDADLDAAWGTEAKRRLAEMESGAIVPIPIADAVARARRAIE